MRGKVLFIGGLAAGWVLGTRAGRERYEQLLDAVRKVKDHPTVQEAAGVVQAQAKSLYSEGKSMVGDRLSHTKLGEKLSLTPSDADAAIAGSTNKHQSNTF
jgi:hypothetical protein